MRIVVNARFLRSDYLNSYSRFQLETLSRIVKSQPQHEFIFLFDKPVDNVFLFGKNSIPLYLKPEAKSPLSWKWWFDIKVPTILRKYKADVFVSLDGFLSMRTKVPQCLFIQDLSFWYLPSSIKKSHRSFYLKNIPRYLLKSASLCVGSGSAKQDLSTIFSLKELNAAIIYSVANECFQPVDAGKQHSIKDAYTNGYTYFLYTGNLSPAANLINLLKSFSIFKKRQKSSWKLVLEGNFSPAYKEEFLKSLSAYKYRDDVLLIESLPEPERASLVAAAYALVNPCPYESFATSILESMQSGVPVIAADTAMVREITGEAALYADVNDPASIADKMMQLYKDESLRTELMAVGREVSSKYNWDSAAELLWQSILKAAK